MYNRGAVIITNTSLGVPYCTAHQNTIPIIKALILFILRAWQVECLHIVGTENLLARVCDPAGPPRVWRRLSGFRLWCLRLVRLYELCVWGFAFGSRLRGIAIIARRNIRIMIMPSAVLMVVMLLMTMMMVAVVVVMNLFCSSYEDGHFVL